MDPVGEAPEERPVVRDEEHRPLEAVERLHEHLDPPVVTQLRKRQTHLHMIAWRQHAHASLFL